MAPTQLSYGLFLALAAVVISDPGFAATLSAPPGGAAIPLHEGQVLCGDPGGGWQADPSGTSLRPPTDPAQIGKTTQARVAASIAACPMSKDFVTLGVSGPIPVVDRHSVDLWIDEGRIELRGTNLDGTRLDWETKGEHGSNVCVAPILSGAQQSCSYSVSKRFPADVAASSIRLIPAGLPPPTLKSSTLPADASLKMHCLWIPHA